MSDVTLTFFKRIGDKNSDVFRGANAEPDDPPGQWEVLLQDEELRNVGLNMLVIEYHKQEQLPEGYRTKITRTPYLDVRHKEDFKRSVAYPGRAPLSANAIKGWVMENIKRYSDIAVTDEKEMTVEEKIDAIKANQEDETGSWVRTGLITAGLAGVGVATVIAINKTKTGQRLKKKAKDYWSGSEEGEFLEEQFADQLIIDGGDVNVKWEKEGDIVTL